MKKPTVLLFLLLVVGWAWAGDAIPTFHNDNQRTGRTENIGPTQPQVLWSFKTQASITGSPIIADDGTIYVASTDKILYALNPDGTAKWVFKAEESIFGTPTLAQDGSVIFGDLDGKVYAVNPDGTQKWLYRFLSGSDKRIIVSPLVDSNGQIYVCSWNKEIRAIKEDGTVRWTKSLGGYLSSSPAMDENGNIYVAEKEGSNLKVHQFSPNSSTAKWTYSKKLDVSGDRLVGAPALDTERGHLVTGTCTKNNGTVHCVQISNHLSRWTKTLPKGILSSPAIGHDGTIYIGTLGGGKQGASTGLAKTDFGLLYALNPDTGAEKWVFQTQGYYIYGSPTVDGNGLIYVGDSDGILYALSPEGKELWRFETGGNITSAPIIARDGTLYLTSFDSTLYAIQNPTAVFDWRQF